MNASVLWDIVVPSIDRRPRSHKPRDVLSNARDIISEARLVSVNICSAEGYSAGIFVGKVSPGIFELNKGKMNASYFRRDKTAVLGAVKPQLPFSEGKYQLPNSWNKTQLHTHFYHMNFQLPHPNRS